MRTTLIRIQRAVTLALACLCIGTAHSQQPSQATVEAQAARALATLAQDDAILDQNISVIYGRDITAEKRAIAKAQLRWFLRDERVAAYLVRLMLPVASPTLTPKDAQAFVVEGMASLKARGLRRLPTERKAQVVHRLERKQLLPLQVRRHRVRVDAVDHHLAGRGRRQRHQRSRRPIRIPVAIGMIRI